MTGRGREGASAVRHEEAHRVTVTATVTVTMPKTESVTVTVHVNETMTVIMTITVPVPVPVTQRSECGGKRTHEFGAVDFCVRRNLRKPIHSAASS